MKILTVTFAKIVQQILSYKGTCTLKYEILFWQEENNKVPKGILRTDADFRKLYQKYNHNGDLIGSHK